MGTLYSSFRILQKSTWKPWTTLQIWTSIKCFCTDSFLNLVRYLQKIDCWYFTSIALTCCNANALVTKYSATAFLVSREQFDRTLRFFQINNNTLYKLLDMCNANDFKTITFHVIISVTNMKEDSVLPQLYLGIKLIRRHPSHILRPLLSSEYDSYIYHL